MRDDLKTTNTWLLSCFSRRKRSYRDPKRFGVHDQSNKEKLKDEMGITEDVPRELTKEDTILMRR